MLYSVGHLSPFENFYDFKIYEINYFRKLIRAQCNNMNIVIMTHYVAIRASSVVITTPELRYNYVV